MKELETLKLYRGATSVIELDFTGFNFESNSSCQFTIQKKYNEDIIFQHDFNKSIKYYVTFKDEFTAGLDDDKYKYDIMYMLNDERYPQCSISNIIIDEVVNNYVGDYDENAVQVTEVLAEGVEITQSIKVTTSNVIIVSSNLQERTVTPTKEEQVILAEDGFDGMSKVVVEAIPSEYVIPTLQDKTIEVKPLENKNITADVGFNGLGVVNVIGTIDTETKEVTPTKEIQTITRSDDKYIESVTVNAIPDNYIEPSGEMEITENGSYDVKDKASVKVETSGADLSEYFNTNPSETTIDSNTGWALNNYFLKMPDITITQENADCTSMFHSWKLPILPKLKNTKNIKKTERMFMGCITPSYDFSEWDISNITFMNYMFSGCNIEELDLRNWDISGKPSMQNIFENCGAKKILAPNLCKTAPTTSVDFEGCQNLEVLDISGWDTSTSSSMANFFKNCKKLTTLDLKHFVTSNVTSFTYMFNTMSALTDLDISTFDFSKATNISYMFSSTPNLINLNFGTDVGKGFSKSQSAYYQYKLDLSSCILLTHDSLISVLNGLYDLNLTYDVANGGTLYTQQLVLGETNLAKLTEEEIAIATNKGWSVS